MRHRILAEKKVSDFIRWSPRWARNYAAIWIIVHGAELRRILEGEEVSGFVSVGSQKMSGCASGRVLVSRGLGVLVSLLPMKLGADGLER